MMHSAKIYNTSSDSVYLDLRSRIVARELKPAQRLQEVKIANEMGVSRTPVREALRRLAVEGLVRIVPNSGARVASPTEAEIDNVFRVREYLESMSVKLACEHGIETRVIDRIEDSLIREEKAFFNRDMEGWLSANNEFHLQIAEAGKNSVLCEYIENVILRTNVFVFFFDSFGSVNNSLSGHRAILHAVVAGDGRKALAKLKEHLEESRGSLVPPKPGI